jgi:hypothetical protein
MRPPEIRRISAPSQPGQKCLGEPISKGKKCVWWHLPVIPAMEKNIK